MQSARGFIPARKKKIKRNRHGDLFRLENKIKSKRHGDQIRLECDAKAKASQPFMRKIKQKHNQNDKNHEHANNYCQGG